ncbi:MAG TPA: flagellar biosynthesis protein FlhB [Chroococcales cyanobacterium]
MGEEKTEPATDHKREEARQRGNVLKSQDAIIALLLFVFASTINFVGKNAYTLLYGFFKETYETLSDKALTFSFALAMAFLLKAMLVLFLCVAPLAAFSFAAAYIGNLAQIGILFSTKALSIEENIKKLNPFTGFKKIFNLKQVVELLKAFLKILIISGTIFGVIKDKIGPILLSGTMHPAMALGLAGSMVVTIAQRVALAMVGLALIDYFFQRWQYEKGLRMSKQEIKDEYKKLEGDPMVKARLRQKQMEMAMGAMQQAVPNADVVVTNPTHYAVALEYKPKRGMKAPKVIAKGKNRIALEIRRIAEENFITVVEDPPTARALYLQVEIDQDIPAELFGAVAKIIALLYKRKAPVAIQPLTEIPASPVPYFIEEELEKEEGKETDPP